MKRLDYSKEKAERRLNNEIDYVIKNPQRGKEKFPSTYELLEKVVLTRFDDLDNIMVLEKALESFYSFRKDLRLLLSEEKKEKISQQIKMVQLILESSFDETIVQDRLIELTPQFEEMKAFLIKEEEKCISKRTYCWIKSKQKLKLLFLTLMGKNLISKETKIEDFNKVFNSKSTDGINKINWIGQKNLLAYLLDDLHHKKFFQDSNKIYSIAKDCFTNSNNLSKLKHQYLEVNKNGKPKNHSIIDDVLKTIEHIS